MLVSAREALVWMPLILAAALVVLALLHNTHLLVALGVTFEPWLFERIEHFRRHGLTVDAAVGLAADQEDVDECELAVAHFGHLAERYCDGERAQNGSHARKERSIE